MSLLKTTLEGTHAAESNALDGDYPAVIAALEHTAKLLKDEMNEQRANAAGIVPLPGFEHPIGPGHDPKVA